MALDLSSHNGTIQITYDGLHVDSNGVATYSKGEKTTASFVLENYAIAYVDWSNFKLFVVPVKGAGSEFQPKVSLHMGEYSNNVLRQQLITTDYASGQASYMKGKWVNEDNVDSLDDFVSKWNDIFGGNTNVYYMEFPTGGGIVNKWDTAIIDDVTGENVLISPYGMYNWSSNPNDVTFTSFTESYDYAYDNYGGQAHYEMPAGRMTSDAEGLYCWHYYTVPEGYNLHTSAIYTGNHGYWYDGQNNLTALMVQIACDWNTDNLNAEEKGYHRFKGIRWDVWLDGDGEATSIAIRRKSLGGEIPSNYDTMLGVAITNKTIGIDINLSINDVILITGNDYDTTRYAIRKIMEETATGSIDMKSYEMWLRFRAVDLKELEDGKPIHSDTHAFFIPFDLPSSADDFTIKYSDKDDRLKIETELYIHLGTPPDNDSYDDSTEDSDDITESEGYNGIGLLTKQYGMTELRCQQLGYTLWEASFIENIKLVNNNPIENIIGLKVYPFDVSGTTEEIIIGNVPMDVNGDRITSFNNKVTIGSIQVEGMYNSFLDFSPFTKLTIWLPFIGFKDLDTSACMYKTLTVRYIRDIITGACKADLLLDGKPWQTFDGEMGIDIALQSSNRAQVDAAFVNNAISTISSGVGNIASGKSAISNQAGTLSVATGLIDMGTDLVQSAMNQYHTTNTGTPSPSCSAYQTRDVFLIYDRPTYQDLAVFNHTYGRMCMLSRTLGGLTGFTKTSAMIDLDGVPATEEEKQRLIAALSGGFFIN